ncbi:terminase small subunit-like protein [Brevundimonas diminuta]
MPRPLEFNEAVADAICERLADGESLRSICRDDEMPAKSTVFKWLGLIPAFADQYARARETQADSLADDIVDIADNKTLEPNDKRVRIDARKWLAGKLRPKAYGDKVAVVGGDKTDAPIRHSHSFDLSAASDEELDVIERFIRRSANAGGDQGGEGASEG